ncbi:nuclear egress membrane protein [Saguinine gammaherpesvirus 1]|uniref:Nuclear egress membrane protein n=1 Tax=Saguinine gammaherpesvirus 1 TaxID=2169901 RepID=A0A9Q8QY69_9GAMA|nr:nuclear egress membrane protein [Saguinine gammaherpesvirus 1]
MSSSKRLLDELCSIVSTFLGSSNTSLTLDRFPQGPHLFVKGGTQAICTVKLDHGQSYNIEFVYRFWSHKLQEINYPFSPCFIISNNGLATTLKCFLSEPRDINGQYGKRVQMEPDVYLNKNSSVIISEDDFVKFKTNMVFNKDLSIFNSMVICRTYLTEHRQALQFLVVKPKTTRRINNILEGVMDVLKKAQSNYRHTEVDSMVRRPIRSKGRSISEYSDHTQDQNKLDHKVPDTLKNISTFASGFGVNGWKFLTCVIMFLGLIWLLYLGWKV